MKTPEVFEIFLFLSFLYFIAFGDHLGWSILALHGMFSLKKRNGMLDHVHKQSRWLRTYNFMGNFRVKSCSKVEAGK